MERIVYNKTLDVHKNGVQFTLQGFETADNMARRIVISLMASGDTIDFPLEQIKALMYVTTPNATEPSIHDCVIKDNTIIYDVLPIVEEGITEMQLKLIETRPYGANGVLAAPKFAVEVLQSNAEDGKAEQSETYTALENAVAMAKGVYDTRVISIEIDSDCNFIVHYADGTTYETDVLKEVLLKGEALLSQSYARGNTGIRIGENTDNSMYYSNVSKSASADAERVIGEASEILEEALKHGVYTAFSINFDSGEVEYISPSYSFVVDKETGELNAIGESYTPEENIEHQVDEWLSSKSGDIDNLETENQAQGEQIASMQTTLGEHESLMMAMGNDYNRLDGEIQRVDSRITSLDANVQSNYNSIGALNESVTKNANDIAFQSLTLEQTKASIEEINKSQDSQIASLNTGLNATVQQINENKSAISGLKSDVTRLDAKFIITADENDSRLQSATEGTVWIKPLS